MSCTTPSTLNSLLTPTPIPPPPPTTPTPTPTPTYLEAQVRVDSVAAEGVNPFEVLGRDGLLHVGHVGRAVVEEALLTAVAESLPYYYYLLTTTTSSLLLPTHRR